MIGIIVTGHGNFATGLLSAIKLIAGTPEKLVAVDFNQEDSTDDLELNLKNAIKELEDCEEGILIFSDVMEGYPYKISVELHERKKVDVPFHVIAGTNLGMLMEINMGRGIIKDLNSLADLAVETGKAQIVRTGESQKEEDL